MRKRIELMSVWVNFSQLTAANVPVMVFACIWFVTKASSGRAKLEFLFTKIGVG